jgi:hypothetical protein
MNMKSARPLCQHAGVNNETKKENNSFRRIEDQDNETSNQHKSKIVYLNQSRQFAGEQQRRERRAESCKLNSFGELYEDYLCDKEVESYFDSSNPSTVSSNNKSKKIPLTPSFKYKPKEASNVTTNMKKINQLASLYARKNLIASGYVRQCQGESYC